jgi:hypothetical protein
MFSVERSSLHFQHGLQRHRAVVGVDVVGVVLVGLRHVFGHERAPALDAGIVFPCGIAANRNYYRSELMPAAAAHKKTRRFPPRFRVQS